ncbi:hypothetical protein VE02_04371 [Pseudogymnoascus sp. 03VT05]|nr:hypothetical protein VE02_04371 [Pseudogymnoascus sp. 03VT05]
MPIGTIESKKQVDYKLVYGRADGMPNSLESMVVCDTTVAFQTFKIGNLHECHNSNQKFEYYLQHDIAQSFFGPNLGIRAYAEANCQRPPSTHRLSNANSCVHGAGKSFQLLEIGS